MIWGVNYFRQILSFYPTWRIKLFCWNGYIELVTSLALVIEGWCWLSFLGFILSKSNMAMERKHKNARNIIVYHSESSWMEDSPVQYLSTKGYPQAFQFLDQCWFDSLCPSTPKTLTSGTHTLLAFRNGNLSYWTCKNKVCLGKNWLRCIPTRTWLAPEISWLTPAEKVGNNPEHKGTCHSKRASLQPYTLPTSSRFPEPPSISGPTR